MDFNSDDYELRKKLKLFHLPYREARENYFKTAEGIPSLMTLGNAIKDYQTLNYNPDKIRFLEILALKKEEFSDTEIKTFAANKPVELPKAYEYEKILDFEKAAEIYNFYERTDELIKVRNKARNKVEQTVVKGDQITKTEIKDSVLNRSNVGSSSSKIQELKDLAEMKGKGLINNEDFEKMKKEIIG